jgi:hypothetical protein
VATVHGSNTKINGTNVVIFASPGVVNTAEETVTLGRGTRLASVEVSTADQGGLAHCGTVYNSANIVSASISIIAHNRLGIAQAVRWVTCLWQAQVAVVALHWSIHALGCVVNNGTAINSTVVVIVTHDRDGFAGA